MARQSQQQYGVKAWFSDLDDEERVAVVVRNKSLDGAKDDLYGIVSEGGFWYNKVFIPIHRAKGLRPVEIENDSPENGLENEVGK